MDDHAMAAPGDETVPHSTSILTGAASRDPLGAPTGSSLPQTPHRLRRSATDSQRSYLYQAASEKQSLLNDEFSQSLDETLYSHRTGQAIPKDARQRAIDADPNQGKICLISNSEVLAMNLCHVVDRATPTTIIKSLEYSWGLERPFHVDTRRNFLFLDPNYHAGFDNGKFILLPSTQWVEKLWSQHISTSPDLHESPPQLPNVHLDIVPGKQYEYTLVPSTVMKNIPILRDSTIHKFPFVDLPTLLSVVPPHLMIWKVGRLLANNRLHHFTSSEKYADLPSILFKITSLYQLWSTRKVPARYETRFRHPDLPPDGKTGEDSSSHSDFSASRRRGRRGGGGEGPSKGQAGGSAGQATGSKRKRDNGNNDDNNIDRSSKKPHNEDRIVDIVDPDGPYLDRARVRRWIKNTSRSLHSQPDNT